MVSFNELRITPDGKHLIVDVLILSLSYYDNVYIDSIYIDTLETFIETGPSSKPIYVYVVPENIESNVYTGECGCKVLDEADNENIYVAEDGVKHLRLIIDLEGINNNLFFIWVLTRGQASADTPCGMKELMVLGVTYDKIPFYNQAMEYLNALDGCTPDKEFIDFILRKNALEISLKNGNYPAAIKFWDKFFTKIKPKVKSNCGCYGYI